MILPGFSDDKLIALLQQSPTLPEVENLLSFPILKKYEIDHKARSREINERRGIEFNERWKELKKQYKGLDPKDVFSKRQSLSKDIFNSVTASVFDLHSKRLSASILWDQSEHILNILRTRGACSHLDTQRREEACTRFSHRVDLAQFPEVHRDSSIIGEKPRHPFIDHSGRPSAMSPNEYFANTRKALIEEFGHPFYATVPGVGDNGRASALPEQIIGINTDFWAAFLGGDKRLHHDLVYYVPEQTFYFYDPLPQCYAPTTEQKIRVWLGLSLQERAWGQPEKTASMILVQYRSKSVFDEIIAKARAMLAADASYFNGPGALTRWKDRQEVDKNIQIQGAVDVFVKDHLEPIPKADLSLGECLDQLDSFCKEIGCPTISRKVGRGMVEKAVREVYGRGLRNDLLLGNGRTAVGWKGLHLHTQPNRGRLEEGDTDGSISGTSVSSAAALLDVVGRIEPGQILETVSVESGLPLTVVSPTMQSQD